MSIEFPICLYTMPGLLATNPSTKTPTPHLLYESFLQSVSDDIQRYQELQRLACSHADCKTGNRKHVSKAETVR